MPDRLPKRDRLLLWTGERCVPWADESTVIHEHVHRYLWSVKFVGGKRVLDLGSGEGYGAALLAQKAAEVTGVELDALAVEHSSQRYRLPNLSYQEGNVLDLRSTEDGSIDVAVCFEVIEHLSDHRRLLDEVVRVLAPDGMLIVSTPDRDVYNEELGHVNPYHLQELDVTEFRSLLGDYFHHVTMFGQRAMRGSMISPLDDGRDAGIERLAVRRRADAWGSVPFPPPKYLVAVASHLPGPEGASNSLLHEAEASGRLGLRERHPVLGEMLMVGRSLVETARRRVALAMRERNRRQASRR